MNTSKRLTVVMWIWSIMLFLSAATFVAVNTLDLNISRELSDFIKGFTTGGGLLMTAALIILNIKRVRDGFEVVIGDERNRMLKERALSLAFTICLLLLVFIGMILWMINNSAGIVLIAAAAVESTIGIICWVIFRRIS